MIPFCKIIYFLSVLFLTASCYNINAQYSGNPNASYHANWPTASEDTPYYNSFNSEDIKSKVSIKVYYETRCPGSVDFIIRQLEPAVERLAAYMDVYLIPYGGAETSYQQGHYSFTCHHGPTECFGNKLHACAIDTLKNSTKSTLFNACLMRYCDFSRTNDSDYIISVINRCGYKLNTPTNVIWECTNGLQGSNLLMAYGQETDRLNLHHVPYILVDDSADKDDLAYRNLIRTVCEMLIPRPAACDGVS